jgi:hypothetical protein
MAETMLAIPAPLGSASVDKVINAVFPIKTDETDRQRNRRMEINGVIRSLYTNERNGKNYGYNGWSIYNSIVEYIDHYRDEDKNSLAVASMDDSSWATRKKLDAQRAVLALV